MRTAPAEHRWRSWSILAVIGAIIIGGGLGFLVVPVVQGAGGGVDAYTAICRAFGILPGSPARPTPQSQASPYPVTQVAWTEATINAIYGGGPKQWGGDSRAALHRLPYGRGQYA